MHTQFDFVHVVKLTQCFNVKWAWVTTIGPGEPKNSVDLWSFIIMYNIYIYIFFTQKTWCVCTYTYIYKYTSYYDISCNVLYFIFCTMYICITHVYEIDMYVCVYIYTSCIYIYICNISYVYTMCVYIQYVIILFGIVAMIILIILLMTTTRIM